MTLHVACAGAGSPLVLLHGWAMHSGAWGGLPERLARRHRVHAVDLPGHGESTPLPSFTLDALVATLEASPALPPGALTLVGWSLGALVALRWALHSPARVTRLVLVAATPRFVEGDDWPHAIARQSLVRFGDELGVAWKATVQRFVALQVRGSEHERATLAALRGGLFARGEPAPSTLAAGLEVLAHTDLRADVASLSQPALVVGGDRDTLVPPGAGAWLAQRMPHARHATIPGAAHAPFLSHPDAFGALVDAFLDAR